MHDHCADTDRLKHDRRRPVGEAIKGYYPVIVDQTLADRARQMIAGRSFGGEGAGRKGDVYSNLFTGIAKCAVCGGSMFLSHHTAIRCVGEDEDRLASSLETAIRERPRQGLPSLRPP